MTSDNDQGQLSNEEIVCLRALQRTPLYDGAVNLILGGRVNSPRDVLRELAKQGLVQNRDMTWSLTDDGAERLREISDR
jgi:hypothetical protein